MFDAVPRKWEWSVLTECARLASGVRLSVDYHRVGNGDAALDVLVLVQRFRRRTQLGVNGEQTTHERDERGGVGLKHQDKSIGQGERK